jgi:hypothetical protein
MIQLPASNEAVLEQAINPALALLPAKMTCNEVRVMELAIGRHESVFDARDQNDEAGKNGPALGFWQFERNGVLAVMHHPASSQHVYELAQHFGIRYGSTYIWEALASNDVFAAAMARLLLWTDPHPLPAIGDEDAAWELYAIHLWRPGAPSRLRWAGAYAAAVKTLGATA